MNVAKLEQLVAEYNEDDNWLPLYREMADNCLMYARRVIASEKLEDNAEWVLSQFRDQFEDCSEADAIDGLESALAAYYATK